MDVTALDVILFFFVNQNLQNNFFDIFMPFITKKAWMVFLPLVLWCAVRDRKTATIALVLGIGGILLADWAGNTFKYIFERIRPCHVLEGVRLLVGCGKSFSMPSNHAANAFAFMTPFFLLQKSRIRYIFVAVAAMVGFSRIYVGVHYPSDVLAGAFLGTLVSASILRLYGAASRRVKLSG